MIGKLLVRGLAAGLIAGVLAGLFGLGFGEPALDRAIAESHAHENGENPGGAHAHGEEDAFGRGTQKVGLVVGTSLYGAVVGGVFGVVSAFVRGGSALGGWTRSLVLAGAIFVGAVLMPFLKYPPNPPGGDSTASQTPAYLAMVTLSVLAIFFAWRVWRRMAGVSIPVRRLSVGGFLIVSFAALYALLPAPVGPGEVGAGVLWQFRLASLGTQAVLWGALGCVFGLLLERLEPDGLEGGRVSQRAGAPGGVEAR
jgi:predicted cobalt transporter CbtA